MPSALASSVAVAVVAVLVLVTGSEVRHDAAQIPQRSLLYPALARNSRGAAVSMLRLKRMSMMRLKKDADDDDVDASDVDTQVDKRMSMMRLKKPSMMRLRRGPSMMRLKKDDGGEERACLLMKGICFTLSERQLEVLLDALVSDDSR